MSKITAILEADEDGTLHLPVPPELRNAKVRVTATLEAAPETTTAEKRTPLRGAEGAAQAGHLQGHRRPRSVAAGATRIVAPCQGRD